MEEEAWDGIPNEFYKEGGSGMIMGVCGLKRKNTKRVMRVG